MSKWSNAELAILCNRYPHERAQVIADELGRPISSVYSKANGLGIKKSDEFMQGEQCGRITRARRHEIGYKPWTDRELKILHERYPHEKTKTVATAIGRTVIATHAMAKIKGIGKTEAFHTSPDSGRMKTGSTLGMGSRFRPGHVPWSKGTKGVAGQHKNSRRTRFKKGNQREDTAAIGGLRLESKQKVWLVKVCLECKIQHRWKPLARVMWEREHGPTPPKHCIRIDGWDKHNPEPPEAVTLERLECVSMHENMLRNSIHNYPKAVVDAVMQAGRLQREINKQRGRHAKG